MDNDLINLKNLGKTSVNLLRAIGIRSKDDLQRIGSIQAYQAIQARGFQTSKVLLYSLHAALHDRHWSDLQPEEKAFLVQQADAANEDTLEKAVS